MSYSSEILADNPVVYYQMNEASGNPQDSSGNSRHITSTTGTPDYSLPGPLAIGSGIRLNGGEYFVRSSVVSTVTNNFTIDGWFKIEAVTQQDEVLVHNGDSASNGWGMVVNNTGTLQFLAGGVTFGPDSATLINHGHWVHIAVVRRSGTWEYWFNGVFDQNSGWTDTPNTPTTELRINSDSVQTLYAHIALYESALSAARIRAHYRASFSTHTSYATIGSTTVRY